MNLIQSKPKLQLASGTADSTLQVTRPDGGLLLGLWSACTEIDKGLYLQDAMRGEAFFSASELQRAVNNERAERETMNDSKQFRTGGIDR